MKENSENNSSSSIISLEQIKEFSKERKTLKKTKLDLEILRKKSRNFRTIASKTKNLLFDSISKLAERISLKKRKRNVLFEQNPIENSKEVLISTEENQKPKVETIKISLNIVEYAPKIFDRLRKLDGVGFKELLESKLTLVFIHLFIYILVLWTYF